MSETRILKHCTKECAWDENMTHCTGCLLTKKELKNWYRLDDEGKRAALEAAEVRRHNAAVV